MTKELKPCPFCGSKKLRIQGTGERTMEINFDDAIGEYVTKIGEKIRETREEFILESLMPYAQTVESRIDKESLSKAIRMYYGKDVQEVRHGEWDEIRDAYGHLEGWIHRDCGRMSMAKENYCPNCGAKMDLGRF